MHTPGMGSMALAMRLPPALLDPLRFARLDITLEALEPTPLTGFVGPMLRGVLGRTLLELTQLELTQLELTQLEDAHPAFHGPDLYRLIFDPPKTVGEPDPPPAYLLHPPPPPAERLVIGDTLRFGLDPVGGCGAVRPCGDLGTVPLRPVCRAEPGAAPLPAHPGDRSDAGGGGADLLRARWSGGAGLGRRVDVVRPTVSRATSLLLRAPQGRADAADPARAA